MKETDSTCVVQDRHSRRLSGRNFREQAHAVDADAWRSFFYGTDIGLGFCMAFKIVNRVVYAGHCEKECMFTHMPVDGRRMSFFNYPWVDAESPGPDGRTDAGTFEAPQARSVMLITDLNEKDVILGTQPKMKAMAEAVKAESENADIIFINVFCVPLTIGDDTSALVEECRRVSKCPVLSMDLSSAPAERADAADLGVLLKQVFDAFLLKRKAKGKRAPDSVNLVDFPKRYADEELVPLLGELGIGVNARVFPHIDIREIKNYADARFQVFYSSNPRNALFEPFLRKLSVPVMKVPAPYGAGGSYRCLLEIAGAFGKEKMFERVWRKRFGLFRDEFSRILSRTRGQRVAFVADRACVRGLLSADGLMGVPVVSMLREMGFGVDILMYRTNASRVLRFECPRPPDEGALSNFSKHGVQFHSFSSERELGELLAGGKFRAVYSDIFFDRRITRAGKAQFSLRNFRMGLTGLLESISEMEGICRMPFYEKYAKYL